VTPDLLSLVRVLSGGEVDYMIVGGVAAGIHGALRTTLDMDILYSRAPPMLIKLKRAAGRGKDREALAELEVLLEERGDHR
jgi:hypothetical protein